MTNPTNENQVRYDQSNQFNRFHNSHSIASILTTRATSELEKSVGGDLAVRADMSKQDENELFENLLGRADNKDKGGPND